MILSLIGMTGSGKSYWSEKLERIGFTHYCCDDLIEEKLGRELKHLGYSGIKDVAKWMGQPFDQQYKETSQKYLDFEKEVMREIFAEVEKSSATDNIVINTTGSVIYNGDEILNQLANLTRIFYLETPESVKERMYKLYIVDPKPVVWGDAFTQKEGESDFEALKRCYPILLKTRTEKYEKLADVTLDYHQLRSKDFTIETFLNK